MLLLVNRNARFHVNTRTLGTGNERQPNRKRNRFPVATLSNCWQIARGKETSGKRLKETKARMPDAGRYRESAAIGTPKEILRVSLFF